MGERDKRVPAGEVMRLAGVYRKRSLNEVAAGLLEGARSRAPADAQHVEDEIERFFAEGTTAPPWGGEFLAEAKRALPVELYEQEERVYRGADGPRPPALVSAS